MMRPWLTVLLIFVSWSCISAQIEVHHRVKVYLDGKSPAELEDLGLEADHGIIKPGVFIINDYGESEVRILNEHNIRYDILIRDVADYYARRNREIDRVMRSRYDCEAPRWEKYPVPVNFSLGSMGGFPTLSEIYHALDSMHQLFPDLIMEKTPISNVTSHMGHHVYHTRISGQSAPNQQKPKVLFTALHHAREPASVSQMLFFMWYLLENYGINQEVTYLLDNTDMYFVPCVNPDGYLYNELWFPNGGGLWRKNRRANANGSYGVDLNRNYGYMWGSSNTGSSPNPSANTYRGPSPFSEPETQNIKWLAEEKEFVIALNYHSFGNLLVHPWGYTANPTADTDIYTGLSNLFTHQNHYHFGTDIQTIGYSTNGSSDDWLYGDTVQKPAAFAFTPEVGDEFWPPSSLIIPLCLESLWQNLAAAHVLLNYGKTDIHFDPIITNTATQIELEFTRYGFESGEIPVSVVPVSSNIISDSVLYVFDLPQGSHQHKIYELMLSSEVEDGDEVVLVVNTYLPGVTISDTLSMHFSYFGSIVVNEQGNSMSGWLTNEWGLTSEHFKSPPASINDSPGSYYAANSYNILEWNEWIDLINADHAMLKFWARWHIEPNYDYVQLQVKTETSDWMPMCGKYTRPGSNFQAYGEQLWDGLQDAWVLEYIDLSAFAGEIIRFRWVLYSDAYIEHEGFYIDNIQLMIEQSDPALGTAEYNKVNWTVSPNPAGNHITLTAEHDSQNKYTFRLSDARGNIVYSAEIYGPNHIIPAAHLPAGTYHLHVMSDEKMLYTVRVILVR